MTHSIALILYKAITFFNIIVYLDLSVRIYSPIYRCDTSVHNYKTVLIFHNIWELCEYLNAIPIQLLQRSNESKRK